MRRLDQVLAGLGVDTTDWTLQVAWGISEDGRTIASAVGPRAMVVAFEASLIAASRCGCLLSHLEVVCRDH